ncbi:MAG: hypothetical protein LBL96_00510 [Clostridiales bacterium]|nr:hypothetical protein [Clostridiales bacterium]
MSAVFEVNVLTKKSIPYSSIEKILNNYLFGINSVKVMDDWEYNNYKDLDKIQLLSNIDRLLLNNKIILTHGYLDRLHSFGFIISMDSTNAFSSSFWISTEKIRMLDTDGITHENVCIYDIITHIIIGNIDKEDFILCGMGVETFMPSNLSTDELVHKSKNIYRWILNQNNEYDFLANYHKKTEGKYILYSLLSV